MNEKIKSKAQEIYPIESHANEHTAFLQGYMFGKEWIKLKRDSNGFLIGDVSDLQKYVPFLLFEDMSGFLLPNNVYIVDKGNFGEWCDNGILHSMVRFSHILPNVPLIDNKTNY